MFPGVHDHPEFHGWMNQLHLEVLQTSEACFHVHSRNRFPFNRIFAVLSAGKKLSRLYSHTAGSELLMEPGSIFFIPYLTDLEFEFRNDTRFFAFHFNVQAGVRDLFAGQTRMLQHRHCMKQIRQLQNCFAEREPDTRTLWFFENFLCGEISYFLPPGGTVKIESERWKKLLTYVQTQANATTSIADLAQVYQDSADHFSRLFSREFHMTAKHYLETELIRRAGKMLITSDKTIKEIAEELHFSDEFYFSRFFRKHIGLAPGKYRKQCWKLEG